MQIHCFASVPLDADEPVSAIRQFVRLLRDSGIATDRSQVDLILSADGFRWKGSSEASSAKLLLLDAKSMQRKQRFDLSAHLLFEASDPKNPSVDKMLAEIARATGSLARSCRSRFSRAACAASMDGSGRSG